MQRALVILCSIILALITLVNEFESAATMGKKWSQDNTKCYFKVSNSNYHYSTLSPKISGMFIFELLT